MSSKAFRSAMFLLVAGIFTFAPSLAEAIPAFARKYQTSCQTCHIAYPKLNTFGEAFRLAGYRMPEETEDMIKEKPVSLGAPAYKRVWPDAVWPSDIPGTVPLSVNMIFTDETSRSTDPETGESEKVTNDFHFPEEVALLMGGTLGETLSFFGEMVFAQGVEDGESVLEVELEHAQLNFNGPFGSGPAFNLKVGRFAPEIAYPFRSVRLLTGEGPASIFEYAPIEPGGGSGTGEEGIAVPGSVDGLEAYGVVSHRFLYSGGFSNGLGPGAETFDGNSSKDVFGRAAYKFGGLAWDGSGYVASAKNWQEKSASVGLFGYRGNGKGVLFPAEDESVDLEDRTFNRVGWDANVFYQDLNVIAGYVHGRDTLAQYTPADDGDGELLEQNDFTYNAWFLEGDYVIWPWLHGALRYEFLSPANAEADDFKRLVVNVTALVRANVKAYAELYRDLGASDDYTFLATLRVVF